MLGVEMLGFDILGVADVWIEMFGSVTSAFEILGFALLGFEMLAWKYSGWKCRIQNCRSAKAVRHYRSANRTDLGQRLP